MAKLSLRDAWVEVDGRNLSRYAFEVEVETAREEVTADVFGSPRQRLAAPGFSRIVVSFFQDLVAAAVDDVLWPLSKSDATFLVRVRPTSGPISPTNPVYGVWSTLPSYAPLVGRIGGPVTADVAFLNADGAVGLARADGLYTSPILLTEIITQ